jgi:hypothetical protein
VKRDGIYTGKDEHGCIIAAVSNVQDSEDDREWVAQSIGEMVLEGLIVEKTYGIVTVMGCSHNEDL